MHDLKEIVQREATCKKCELYREKYIEFVGSHISHILIRWFHVLPGQITTLNEITNITVKSLKQIGNYFCVSALPKMQMSTNVNFIM